MLYSYQSIIIGSSILLLRGIRRMGLSTNFAERVAQYIDIKNDFTCSDSGSIGRNGEMRLRELRNFPGVTRVELCAAAGVRSWRTRKYAHDIARIVDRSLRLKLVGPTKARAAKAAARFGATAAGLRR
jgi:hypothetical protein